MENSARPSKARHLRFLKMQFDLAVVIYSVKFRGRKKETTGGFAAGSGGFANFW